MGCFRITVYKRYARGGHSGRSGVLRNTASVPAHSWYIYKAVQHSITFSTGCGFQRELIEKVWPQTSFTFLAPFAMPRIPLDSVFKLLNVRVPLSLLRSVVALQ